MKKLIKFLVGRSLFGNVLTVGLLLAGIITMLNMRREAFPNIEFDIIVTNIIYPGASPKEIEKIIAIPVEREVKGIDGIKKSRSTSLSERYNLVITIDPDVKDKRKVIDDIKDAIDRAKVDFPDDVVDPNYIEIGTGNSPMITLTMTAGQGKKLTEFQLRNYAKQLKDKLELINEVSSVATRGYRDREIHVEVSPEKLTQYNISTDDVINALKMRNINFPGGTIDYKSDEYVIRTIKEFQEADEIKNVIIRSNDLGKAVFLKDIAIVVDGFKKHERIEKSNGKEAIILTVLQKEKGDTINLAKAVKKMYKDFEKEKKGMIKMTHYNDMSFYIERRLGVLKNNVFIGIVLVIASLLFFLGWRVAVMVALGIPFSFALTFMVMGYLDISINLISMFGLIIVSGMIVDDAIVVGENVYRKIEEGMKPVTAAIQGAQEMAAPVFASVTTTMLAFFPLMMMSGIMGKFIWVLPAGVIIALTASLLETFLILPAHLADIMKNSTAKDIAKNENSFEMKIFTKMKNLYRPTIIWAVKHKAIMMLIIVGVMGVSVAMLKKTGFVLFPKGAIETFFVKVEAPKGLTLEETNRRVSDIENAISNLPKKELDAFTTRIGIHQENANDPFTKRGKNYAQFSVFLTPPETRSRSSEEIISYLKRKVNAKQPILYIKPYYDKNGNLEKWLKVSNKNIIEIYNINNIQKPIQKISLGKEFFIGGGLTSHDKLIVYTGSNNLITYDLRTKKSCSKKIKLEKYDAPDKFFVEPNGQFSLLITTKNKMYKVGCTFKKNHLKTFSNKITKLKFFSSQESQKIKKQFMVSTNEGSFHVWNYKDKILEKNISFFNGVVNNIKSFFNIEYTNAIESEFSFKKTPSVIIDKKSNKRIISNDKTELLSAVQDFTIHSEYLPQKQKEKKQLFAYIASFDGVIRKINLSTEKIVDNYFVTNRKVSFISPVFEGGKILFNIKDKIIFYDLKNKKKINTFTIRGNIQHCFFEKNKNFNKNNRNLILFADFGYIYQFQNSKLSLLKKGMIKLEKVEYKQAGGGPPVGKPVSIEIKGDNFETIKEIAEIVKEKLYQMKGVYDIQDNWEAGSKEFHLEINEERVAMAGISVFQIASTVQTAFEGKVATSIKKADEEIDIKVMFPEKLRNNINSLKKIMVKNRIGNLVPITEVAYFKPGIGISNITHSNFRRTIYVTANINERKNTSLKVNTAILKIMKPIMKKYAGYDILAGGEYEDTQESLKDMKKAGLISIIGITAILILLYGNFRHPLSILLAVPLGFVGVSVSFFFHKTLNIFPNLSFSFMAMMGIIGLVGIVVNDSIVLVDYINTLIKDGMKRHDAIIEGSVSRLRAVILTTVTTVFGLFPTAYGIGGSDPFLMPMALGMGWGLMFATMITLIVVPVSYEINETFFDFRKKIQNETKHNILVFLLVLVLPAFNIFIMILQGKGMMIIPFIILIGIISLIIFLRLHNKKLNGFLFMGLFVLGIIPGMVYYFYKLTTSEKRIEAQIA